MGFRTLFAEVSARLQSAGAHGRRGPGGQAGLGAWTIDRIRKYTLTEYKDASGVSHWRSNYAPDDWEADLEIQVKNFATEEMRKPLNKIVNHMGFALTLYPFLAFVTAVFAAWYLQAFFLQAGQSSVLENHALGAVVGAFVAVGIIGLGLALASPFYQERWRDMLLERRLYYKNVIDSELHVALIDFRANARNTDPAYGPVNLQQAYLANIALRKIIERVQRQHTVYGLDKGGFVDLKIRSATGLYMILLLGWAILAKGSLEMVKLGQLTFSTPHYLSIMAAITAGLIAALIIAIGFGVYLGRFKKIIADAGLPDGGASDEFLFAEEGHNPETYNWHKVDYYDLMQSREETENYTVWLRRHLTKLEERRLRYAPEEQLQRLR
ncbi:MAG: hypothetical protein V3V30_01455 [Parvularculaceae bacterium]